MTGGEWAASVLPASVVPVTAGRWQTYPFDDPFARHVGPLFRLDRDDAEEPLRIGFTIAAAHCNPLGFCHGGMLATLLDLGLGIVGLTAAGATNETPTIQMSIDFLRPAALGDWMETRCRFVHATRRIIFTEGMLITAAGAVVRGSGIYRRGYPRPQMPT